ncbi:MAG: hypothetical protein P4M11_12435 [Candidatus Pacebacteria bacterium]|nr:hypothetical protein [Candidatus Paceibacterota bacterium]
MAEVQDAMIDTSIVDIIYKILTDEESWYLVREMLWTLSIICKSRTVLKEFSKIIPALISHALSEHESIRVQALMVLAALSYNYENHPIYLKYRFLEEVTKMRSSFKKDDERYLPIIIILSNLSANTAHTLSLSNELANFCMQLIEVTRPDDILFKEACKSFANITYLQQFDHSWIQPLYFCAGKNCVEHSRLCRRSSRRTPKSHIRPSSPP